jgi:hypothetical protein
LTTGASLLTLTAEGTDVAAISAVGGIRSVDPMTASLPWLIAGAARRRVEAELQSADVRVKAHEATHIAIAGPYAESAAQYDFAIGPDGRLYAVGGSVRVDLQPVPGDPEATLRKATAIMQAALGPGEPSAADMRVAARAYAMAMQARREIEAERAGEAQTSGSLVDIMA